AINLDFLAGVLAEEHRVARLHIERRHLAVLLDPALADGNDLALLRLLLGVVGDDDALDALFALVDTLDDDAVVQWSHAHDYPLHVTRPSSRRSGGPEGPGVENELGGPSWQSVRRTVSSRSDRLLNIRNRHGPR